MGLAIITGASSGIGHEFAVQLDANIDIDEMWLIGRDINHLKECSAQLTTANKLFSIDLTNEKSLKIIEEKLQTKSVTYLVNSAGFGANGEFSELDLNNQLNMIELNCTALVELTHLVLPSLVKGGAIINISSIAGFSPLGAFAIYGATKAFVNSFSVALTAELKDSGRRVITVTPGSVDTNFQKRSRGTSNRKKKMFAKKSSTKDVVTKALKDLNSKRVYSTYGTTAILARVVRKLAAPFFIAKLAFTKIYPSDK